MIVDGPSRARLAAVCALLSFAAVSCDASSISARSASPGPTVSPIRVTGSLSPAPTGAVPILNGCPSGVVTVNYLGEGDWTVCVRTGSRLRLTLPDDGYGTWSTLRVTPAGAAAVAATTDSKGNVRAIVTPASTIPFCLATDLAPASPTAPDFPWQLCVTIRR